MRSGAPFFGKRGYPAHPSRPDSNERVTTVGAIWIPSLAKLAGRHADCKATRSGRRL